MTNIVGIKRITYVSLKQGRNANGFNCTSGVSVLNKSEVFLVIKKSLKHAGFPCKSGYLGSKWRNAGFKGSTSMCVSM